MDKECMECSYCFECEDGLYLIPPCQQEDEDDFDDEFDFGE